MFKKLIYGTVFAFCALSANAVNPFLPLWEYIPDAEPYVFEDPDNKGKYRMYIYGSHDSETESYCGREQVVWSAPTENLNDWRYDGIIFTSVYDRDGNLLNGDGRGDVLFAPDVMEYTEADGTKTYYLYPNTQAGGRNGMIAKSSRPDGPFTVCNWDKADAKKAEGVLGFDPAVFVDDDGKVYGYWGFEESWGAELDPETMATVRPGSEAVKDMVSSKKQPGIFRFFEASSMRKIKDKYVFVYSRWTADGEFGLSDSNYTLAYAYSDNPLGPWTYGGTIIDGRARMTLPDGTTVKTAHPAGNTHGSIVEVNGQWYVVYHRQTGLDEFSRQAMVAPIEVKVTEGPGGKVEISEGEYTSEGFEIGGLRLQGTYPAGIACYYTGPEPATNSFPNFSFPGSYVRPTRFGGNPAWAKPDVKMRTNPVVNNTSGSAVGYKYFNFDTADGKKSLTMKLDLMPLGVKGEVKVLAGGTSPANGAVELGSFTLTGAEAHVPATITVTLDGIDRLKGKQPLFLTFDSESKGVSLCELYSFGFE